jgi:putative transcriptional regulator
MTFTAAEGKRLRRRRHAAGMSQASLAEACGVHRNTITALEAGRHQPRADLALRLSAHLGVPAESLFGPLAEPVTHAKFRRIHADDLAAELIDAASDDEPHVIAWALPTLDFARSLGMTRVQYSAERARALLAQGEAISELRQRGWQLDVQVRHDIAPPSAELLVVIEAVVVGAGPLSPKDPTP